MHSRLPITTRERFRGEALARCPRRRRARLSPTRSCAPRRGAVRSSRRPRARPVPRGATTWAEAALKTDEATLRTTPASLLAAGHAQVFARRGRTRSRRDGAAGRGSTRPGGFCL